MPINRDAARRPEPAHQTYIATYRQHRARYFLIWGARVCHTARAKAVMGGYRDANAAAGATRGGE